MVKGKRQLEGHTCSKFQIFPGVLAVKNRNNFRSHEPSCGGSYGGKGYIDTGFQIKDNDAEQLK